MFASDGVGLDVVEHRIDVFADRVALVPAGVGRIDRAPGLVVLPEIARSALRRQMVGQREDGVAPEGELREQRLARVGVVAGVDCPPIMLSENRMRSPASRVPSPSRSVNWRRCSIVALAGEVAELDATGIVEEADADVAALLAALGVVDRQPRRPTDRPCRSPVLSASTSICQVTDASVPVGLDAVAGRRAVIVLDLLDRQDVGRVEVVRDRAARCVELPAACTVGDPDRGSRR